MSTEEFLRALRRFARRNKLEFSVQRRRGKGSHAMILLEDRRSFVPMTNELPQGTQNAILRQLGLLPSDLQRRS